MKKYDVKTTKGIIKVTEEDIEDIMCTALEGGINYWACLDTSGDVFKDGDNIYKSYSEICAEILMYDGWVWFIDKEDNERHPLTIYDLFSGIRRWVDGGYDMYGAVDGEELDCGSIDSECADCIIQLALFGEIVYG